MRQALDAVLHGTEADLDLIDAGTRVVLPPPESASVAGPADASAAGFGAWETLVHFEEARWLRYGHPCVAVQMEVVGGHEVATHLGVEAGARVRVRLDELLLSQTRASDRFEHRPAWRVVALLTETDLAGATAALERIQRAFAEAMGPALAVRIAVGVAAPAPTGTLSVAFHQANQQLVAQHRRGQLVVAPTEEASRPMDRVVPGPGRGVVESTEASTGPSATTEARTPARDLAERLDALAGLLEGGRISEAEFLAKRAEIVDRL
jgi:hypothetical protein